MALRKSDVDAMLAGLADLEVDKNRQDELDAQAEYDSASVQLVALCTRRERAWFLGQARLRGMTLTSVMLELMTQRFGPPPADFHVPHR